MASVMNLTGYIVVGHDHAQADVFTVISLHIVGMFGLVLVVGQLVDRVGRHRALVGGLLVMAVSSVLLAWVVEIAGISISLFLLGLGWNISYVAASAELVTHAKPVERQGLVGFTDLIAGLTAAGLALIGGFAYTQWGVVAISVGATVAVIGPAILISLRRPPGGRARTDRIDEGRLAAPLVVRSPPPVLSQGDIDLVRLTVVELHTISQ
jgi:MFS family permease